jgi:hypothetical protein
MAPHVAWLFNLEAAGEQVAVQAPRLGVGIGAVRPTQVPAQLLVPCQCLRPPAHRRMAPHRAPNCTLVQRVGRERALQRIERRCLMSGRAGGVREVYEEIAKTLAQLLTRPGSPVFEPVLGEQIARVRCHGSAQISEDTARSGQCRQLLEAPYVHVDETVREQRHNVVTQLQQAVAWRVPR